MEVDSNVQTLSGKLLALRFFGLTNGLADNPVQFMTVYAINRKCNELCNWNNFSPLSLCIYIYFFIFYVIKKRIWSRYNIIDFLRVLFYIILYIVYKNDYTDIYRLKIKRNRYLDIIRVYFLVYDVHSTEYTMDK